MHLAFVVLCTCFMMNLKHPTLERHATEYRCALQMGMGKGVVRLTTLHLPIASSLIPAWQVWSPCEQNL